MNDGRALLLQRPRLGPVREGAGCEAVVRAPEAGRVRFG